MPDPVITAEISAGGLRRVVVEHDAGDKESGLRFLESSFRALAELDRQVRAGDRPGHRPDLEADR